MPDAEGLTQSFRRLIAAHGPISLLQYMGEANARYYASRDPLGSAGDFVTAPEISQMFGEMVGLWLADIWIRAGRPEPVRYVELGPGRGTLARDALRAAQKAGLKPEVHFVEASPALRAVQQAAFPDAQWHDDLSGVMPGAPILLIANEFFDALPVRQLVATDEGWRERMVATAEAPEGEGVRFIPVAGQKPMDSAVPEPMRGAAAGTILETCPGAAAVVQDVAHLLGESGGAALFIDYGYDRPQTGSTLQAVCAHRKTDPFVDPGEADLTALVDFATMRAVAQEAGARWLGTATQGDWLNVLGIQQRAAVLANAAPHKAEEVHAALRRLTDVEEMGRLFKVMGLAGRDWPDGAGLIVS